MTLPVHWFTFGRNSAYDEAIRKMVAGDLENALVHLQSVLEGRPEPEIRNLAESAFVQVARKLCGKALEIRDGENAKRLAEIGLSTRDFADLHILKAKAHLLLGETQDCITSSSRALELNPNYKMAVTFVQVLSGASSSEIDTEVAQFVSDEIRASRFDTALTALEKLTHAAEHEIRQRIHEAQSLSDAGNWDTAIAAWQQLVIDRPQYPDLRCQLGQVLLELNRSDEALEQFHLAIDINPNYADAHALAGVTFKRLGQHNLAKAAFELALSCNPQHSIAAHEHNRK